MVSFEEWQQFLALQKLAEEAKAQGGAGKGNGLLDALYSSSSSSDSFNSLNKNIGGGGGAQRQGGQQAGANRGIGR